MPESSTTSGPTSSPAPKRAARRDQFLSEAVETARAAVVDISRPGSVGEHLGVRGAGERLVNHRFACLDEGYLGWEWEVSLARVPRSRTATVCEVDLLPGRGALLAPPWVPWDERIQPGDLSREDVVPYSANDPRLLSGFEQTDAEVADAVGVEEMGLGRARVLSPFGLDQAAARWYGSEKGPGEGKAPQASCATCGFLLKMNGSLGQLFGVCANEWSPDDGTVVSLDHGCGAHSETDEVQRGPQWPLAQSRVDDFDIEIVAQ